MTADVLILMSARFSPVLFFVEFTEYLLFFSPTCNMCVNNRNVAQADSFYNKKSSYIFEGLLQPSSPSVVLIWHVHTICSTYTLFQTAIINRSSLYYILVKYVLRVTPHYAHFCAYRLQHMHNSTLHSPNKVRDHRTHRQREQIGHSKGLFECNVYPRGRHT